MHGIWSGDAHSERPVLPTNFKHFSEHQIQAFYGHVGIAYCARSTIFRMFVNEKCKWIKWWELFYRFIINGKIYWLDKNHQSLERPALRPRSKKCSIWLEQDRFQVRITVSTQYVRTAQNFARMNASCKTVSGDSIKMKWSELHGNTFQTYETSFFRL